MKRYFVFLSVLGLCFFLNLSCNLTTATDNNPQKFYKYKVTKAEFDFGDSEEFEFSQFFTQSNGKNRLFVQYQKKRRSDGENLGDFLRLSEDNGKTFGREFEVAKLFKSEKKINWAFYFVPNGFNAIGSKDKNLFFSHSDETFENWSIPVQVNDEQNSVMYQGLFVQKSPTEIFLVWVDKRRGFDLIFFSSSKNEGKTWSANKPIDYDFREGNQNYPQFIGGQNGRLLVFWQDWRDRKTLVDIRYSYSDDDGLSWSPSQKINDDEKEVWQMTPRALADGANIYVVFGDFREPGEYGDNDWNIYFARSKDNGATWEKNKRLNDIKDGIDGMPIISIDPGGNLYCLWESTRETLFGQIVFSYSPDKGNSWSPSIPLTSAKQMSPGEYSFIQYYAPDKFFVRIGEEKNGKRDFTFSFLEKTDELIDKNLVVSKKKPKEIIDSIDYQAGKLLFEDDFSGRTAEQWEPESGVWDIVGGTYMGVYPNSKKAFISYAKFEEPESYVLKGRFRLDTVAHTAAILYFRTSPDGLKHYVITNQFRVGTWLSIKDNDLPRELHISGGQPLAQKQYPFRQDRWYQFTLIVTPEQIDYYVDGRLMLSGKVNADLPEGKIGIGGFINSPTYFDDISVREISR